VPKLNLLKNKYLIIFILLTSYICNAKEEILFTVNNKPFTTIDLNQRIHYINLFNDFNINEIEESKFINDLISLVIFNEFASRRKIIINKEKIINIFDSLKNKNQLKIQEHIERNVLTKEIILENIRLDLLRDNIIDKFLVDRINKINIFTNNNIDIFNIELNYVIFDYRYKDKIEDAYNNLLEKEIKYIEKLLKNNQIEYNYFTKKITNLDRINNKLRNVILENKNKFFIIEEKYIMIGIIKKELKKDIDIKYSFFQIKSKDSKYFNIFLKKEIYCDNIENIKLDKKLEITEYDNVDIEKLNIKIFQNLSKENEKLIINNNNQKLLILLCKIDYDKKMAQDSLFQDKIRQISTEIESEFIQNKKQEYKFQIFN